MKPQFRLSLLATLLFSSALYAQSAAPSASNSATKDGKPALTVNVIKPAQASINNEISANGNLAAWQEMSVGTETQGLRLSELLANVGDTVKKGQILAKFAGETIAADLAGAKAALLEAQSNEQIATSQAEKARSLKDTGIYSAQQLTQIYAQEAAAKARVEAAKAQLDSAQLRVKQTTVTAPDNGVVSSRSATVGAVLPAGAELFRLIRGGRLEWRAEVPSQNIAQIKVGQSATIQTAAGESLSGRVRQIAPTVDAQSRNSLVYIDLKKNGAAKAGMFARGAIALSKSNALTVPSGAVLLRDGFSYVFTVKGNKVALTKVETGRRQGSQIEVLSGITADAAIVESGVAFLANGDVVKVANTK